MLARLYQLDL